MKKNAVIAIVSTIVALVLWYAQSTIKAILPPVSGWIWAAALVIVAFVAIINAIYLFMPKGHEKSLKGIVRWALSEEAEKPKASESTPAAKPAPAEKTDESKALEKAISVLEKFGGRLDEMGEKLEAIEKKASESTKPVEQSVAQPVAKETKKQETAEELLKRLEAMLNEAAELGLQHDDAKAREEAERARREEAKKRAEALRKAATTSSTKSGQSSTSNP